MQSFGWWLRKELREHRVTLALLAVILLGGSWLVIDGNQGSSERRPENPKVVDLTRERPAHAHRMDRRQWELLVVGGMTLTLLVIAGGLFSGEARRGTLPTMARTPGAWRSALLGKLAFLVLVTGAGMLIQGLLLGHLAGPYALHERGVPIAPLLLLPRGEWVLSVWLVLGLGAWMLAASTVLPLVGIPALVGLVVGVGTLVPAVIWHVKYPYLFAWWLGSPTVFLAAWALVAMALVVWGWSRSIRYGRPVLHAGLRALAVAVAFVGLSSAVIAATVSRYRIFDAHIADLRLWMQYVGAGDRYLYAEVYRGDPDEQSDSEHERQGTSPRVWRIDLADGTWAELGGEGCEIGLASLPQGLDSSVFDEMWTVLSMSEPKSDDVGWIDARTGEVFARGPSYTPPPNLRERVRAGLRVATPVHDSKRRAAWLLEGKLERDGVEPIALEGASNGWGMRAIPGGWANRRRDAWQDGSDGVRFYQAQTIDAEDGRVRTTKPFRDQAGELNIDGFLNPRRAVVTTSDFWEPPESLHAKAQYGDRSATLRDIRVLDLETSAYEPILKTSNAAAQALRPLVYLGREAVLAAVGQPGSLRIAHVALPEGRIEVLAWEGDALDGVELVTWVADRSTDRMAFPGRCVCLRCLKSDPDLERRAESLDDEDLYGYHGEWRTVEEVLGGLSAWVVYEPASRRLRVLRGWSRDGSYVLRVSDDGSLIANENSRRIVRLGPEPGQREVLFPRR